ncbi:MAG: hypothetical protein EBT13_16870 [Rhodobacteraceae bacterium]|nr:hypothetical protein [Paracoccaceae bacterium]
MTETPEQLAHAVAAQHQAANDAAIARMANKNGLGMRTVHYYAQQAAKKDANRAAMREFMSDGPKTKADILGAIGISRSFFGTELAQGWFERKGRVNGFATYGLVTE